MTLEERKQWLLTRKQGLGGTDVSAVIGVNPYRTALDVYSDKINPEIEEVDANDAMTFGLEVEAVIARRFAVKEGVQLEDSPGIIVSKESPFMIGSVDRLMVHPERGWGVLEIKTVSRGALRHWQGEIPPAYYAQLMTYLYVTNLPYGCFALFVTDSRDIEVLYIERDEPFIQKMVEICKDFWNENVLKQAPPEPVLADMDRLIPVSGSAVEATPEVVSAYAGLLELKEKYEQAEKDYEARKDSIKGFMVDNEVLTINGNPVVTYKKDADGVTVDSKLLQKKYPEVFADVLKTRKGARKFLLKKTTSED
jgi:putative phage-type endonuclease